MSEAEDSGVFIDDGVSDGVPIAAAALFGAVEKMALEYAEKILDYAQENAPWDDRTGDARAGLDVDVNNTETSIDIILSHSVDYGLYLETIQSGRFAIIMPTLEHFAPEMLNNIRLEEGGDDL